MINRDTNSNKDGILLISVLKSISKSSLKAFSLMSSVLKCSFTKLHGRNFNLLLLTCKNCKFCMCPILLGKYFTELLSSFNVTRLFMDINLFGNPSMRLDDISRSWIRLTVSPLIKHVGMDLNWFSCKYTHFKHFKSSKFSHNVDKLFLLRSNIFKYINLKIRESNFFKLQ